MTNTPLPLDAVKLGGTRVITDEQLAREAAEDERWDRYDANARRALVGHFDRLIVAAGGESQGTAAGSPAAGSPPALS